MTRAPGSTRPPPWGRWWPFLPSGSAQRSGHAACCCRGPAHSWWRRLPCRSRPVSAACCSGRRWAGWRALHGGQADRGLGHRQLPAVPGPASRRPLAWVDVAGLVRHTSPQSGRGTHIWGGPADGPAARRRARLAFMQAYVRIGEQAHSFLLGAQVEAGSHLRAARLQACVAGFMGRSLGPAEADARRGVAGPLRPGTGVPACLRRRLFVPGLRRDRLPVGDAVPPRRPQRSSPFVVKGQP